MKGNASFKKPRFNVLFNYKWRFLAYDHFLGKKYNHVSEVALK